MKEPLKRGQDRQIILPTLGKRDCTNALAVLYTPSAPSLRRERLRCISCSLLKASISSRIIRIGVYPCHDSFSELPEIKRIFLGNVTIC